MNETFKTPIIIDLQLFAEEDDTGVDSAVVEPEDGNDGLDSISISLSGRKEQEVADPDDVEDDIDIEDDVDVEDDKRQTPEENAVYAKMRKKAEETARQELAEERKRLEEERAEIRIARERQNDEAIIEKHIAAITDDQVYEVADRRGIPEDVARELLENDARNKAREEGEENRAKLKSVYQEKDKLRTKPFFAELEKELDKIIESDPNVNVSGAYKYLVGEHYERLTSSKSKDTEKRTIANIQDRSKRRAINSNSEGSTDTTEALTSVGKKMAIAMGVDPRKVSKRVSKRRQDFRF